MAYQVQDRGDGEWRDVGELETARSQSVHTVVKIILNARVRDFPGRAWRVLGWDLWHVQRATECDPYPEDGLASTRYVWLSAMRDHVPPHADVTVHSAHTAQKAGTAEGGAGP